MKSKDLAIQWHREVNDLYDSNYYEIHLQHCENVAKKFIHLISAIDYDIVFDAIWLHDTLENCRKNYVEIRNNSNTSVAEIVFAVTNEKGRYRREKQNERYFEGVRKTPNAIFVKLCDRIANVEYSKKKNDLSKIEMYKKEHDFFKRQLTMNYVNLKEMFDYLDSLFL